MAPMWCARESHSHLTRFLSIELNYLFKHTYPSPQPEVVEEKIGQLPDFFKRFGLDWDEGCKMEDNALRKVWQLIFFQFRSYSVILSIL